MLLTSLISYMCMVCFIFLLFIGGLLQELKNIASLMFAKRTQQSQRGQDHLLETSNTPEL